MLGGVVRTVSNDRPYPISATSFSHANLGDLPIAKGDEIAAEFRITFKAVSHLDRI